MRHTRANAGFTLIEMMCALLVMVLLIMGMGVGMDAGSRIYRDATFEADSASLAGILNTSLSDILRYSIQHRIPSEEELVGLDDVNTEFEDGSHFFVFTSLDYGIQDAYFCTPRAKNPDEPSGILQMRTLRDGSVTRQLVNSGAYPDLMVSDLKISLKVQTAPGAEGAYFTIQYMISSATNPAKVRNVEYIVRLLNDVDLTRFKVT